ncbi:hypothetical protein P170DRAFT_432327 [Aspergillus steynii IBT 23096]|uniref:Uncharacterized protein n=1 Tax=Aspergillus steynii IBT 23096 TaxID=1392250 RepID=A0A2I2GP98_9EURO|nr:uncharacterized protein P170DRAFT_432327 [Aspergillus steynii IBT 23096]PLB54700.1 hypothetical protein P170DRAFT_432327 [Aspergillus steynii IBT 23096]
MTTKLIPIDLHDPSQFAELLAQRIQCGWDNDPAHLLHWRSKIDENLKSLFWITVTSPNPSLSDYSFSDSDSEPEFRAGHISLDSYSDLNDPLLANPDRSALIVQNLFIKPEYQRLGLGHKAMNLLEALAPTEPYGSPNCKYVTLSTLSKRHFEVDSPMWETARAILPPGYLNFCVPEWYEKRGYVLWKSLWRKYEPSGEKRGLELMVDLMRKEV